MSPEERIAQIRHEVRATSEQAEAEVRELTDDESASVRALLAEAAALGDPTASNTVIRLGEIEAGQIGERETALLYAEAGSWALAEGVDGLADAIEALSAAERDAMLGAFVVLMHSMLAAEADNAGRTFISHWVDIFQRRASELWSEQ